MPVFQTDKGLVFYSHIPKCGGMSIEKSLSCFPTHLKTPFLHGDNQLKFPCSPQHFHADIISKLFDLDSFYYSFTVTRHPFKRLLSEYKFRSDIAKRQNRTLDRFDNWINRILLSYSKNEFVLDNHIRPQTEFIHPGIKVLKLEDGMKSIVAHLEQVLDVQLSTESMHVNKSTELEISVSLESRGLIRKFYESDFNTFDYDEAWYY